MERGVLGSWREMARGLGQRVLSEGRGGFWKGFLKNRGWGFFMLGGFINTLCRLIFQDFVVIQSPNQNNVEQEVEMKVKDVKV